MTIVSKTNKFFLDFITNVNRHIQIYNKKNKTKLSEITPNWLNDLENPLEELIVFNILFKNPELHHKLILFVDLIRSYSINQKIHPNEIKNFIELHEYLFKRYNEIELYHKLEFLKEKAKYKDRLLLNNKQFAVHRIREYGNLLVSKVIDYLPRDVNDKQLTNLINIVDSYKSYLNTFVDAGVHYWVYLYTESKNYIPFNLKHFNIFDNLGNKIINWTDEAAEHPLEEFFLSNGYDVLHGWGDWHNSSKSETNTNVVINKEEDNKDKPVALSPAIANELVTNIYKHIQMYIHCDKFSIRDATHRVLLARTIAFVLHHHTSGHMVTYGTLKSIFEKVKTLLNKKVHTVSVPKIQTRKDKKYWMNPDLIPSVLDSLKLFIDSRYQMYTHQMIAHAFDVCVPSTEDFKDVVDNHKSFVARSHNRVFHSHDKWSKDEIEEALKLYQFSLLPLYKNITEPETHWVFLSTLSMWLNFKDENIVKDIHYKLKDYFEKRHSAEENETVINRDLQYVKLMSYNNKELLLKMLDENPINLVSYAGSKEIYENMIDIMKKDVYHPDTAFTDKTISISNNGIVVK